METNNKPESKLITVEVAYALPDRQKIISLEVVSGTTALEAARQSGIQQYFPDLLLDSAEMGIFSKHLNGKMLPAPDQYELEEKDRVEIYRPLIIDPKEARKNRAEKAKLKAQQKSADSGGEAEVSV